MICSRLVRRAAFGLAALAVSCGTARAQNQATAQPGQPVTITVTTAAAPPDVSITPGPRTALVTPQRSGCTHTGGGNIDVAQPSPDTLVVTMTGVAVATGAPCLPASATMSFDLNQAFEVSFDKPSVKAAKLTMEARVIGFLRSHGKAGSAEEMGGAELLRGDNVMLNMTVPAHAVSGGQNLAINDHEGPCSLTIAAAKYCLHQTFQVGAAAPKCLCPVKAPSAEFAPDPALDPLWISHKEPFHGAAKKDLGFQVIIKVAPQDVPEVNDKPGK
jgi:hypothetical protein